MNTLYAVLGWWTAISLALGAAIARIGYTLKKTRRSPR